MVDVATERLTALVTCNEEEGNAVTQHPDTPTSQFTAVRWTFYRRFGLLMRTRLQDDGTTRSLHDVAARTHGRIAVDELMTWVAQGAQAHPDAVSCVVLAQALDVDPEFFVSDEAVRDYVTAHGDEAARDRPSSLQQRALAALAPLAMTSAGASSH